MNKPKPPKPAPENSGAETARRNRMVRWLIYATLAWGSLIALGAFVNDPNFSLGRTAVIFSCVAGFIAFWVIMLEIRQARLDREAQEQPNEPAKPTTPPPPDPEEHRPYSS